MKTRLVRILSPLTLVGVALLAGCDRKPPPVAGPPVTWGMQPASAPAAAASAAAAGAARTDGPRGTVVETMDAARYTYVLIDTGAQKVWAAAPQFKVAKGDKVWASSGMPMKNFKSETLNRTFDSVFFAEAIGPDTGTPPTATASPHGAMPPGAMPPGAVPPGAMAGGMGDMPGSMPAGHPDVSKLAAAGAIDLANIKKADNGKTVAEIYAAKAALSGKPVALRAKVVKINAQIMGRNWLHVRDGSGSDGSNDLTVTTDGMAKVGDTVLVQGTLVTDKDFGSGYKYDVLVEGATVKVE